MDIRQISSKRSNVDGNSAVPHFDCRIHQLNFPNFHSKLQEQSWKVFYSVNLYLLSPSDQVSFKKYRSIVRFTVAINAICSREIRCRRDSSVLTQLEVGEHTPRLSCSLSLLVSHGVLSLLGNTEVYCSVLVSSLSLSLSLHPPSSLVLHHSQYTTLCYVSEALSALHIILPTLSAALLSSLHLHLACPMGLRIATARMVHSGLERDGTSLWRTRSPRVVLLDGINNQAHEISSPI